MKYPENWHGVCYVYSMKTSNLARTLPESCPNLARTLPESCPNLVTPFTRVVDFLDSTIRGDYNFGFFQATRNLEKIEGMSSDYYKGYNKGIIYLSKSEL